MTVPHEAPATGPAAVFAATLQAQLPVIETARLRLRAPRIEDFPIYAEIAMGPRGVHLFDNPSRRDVWLDFAQMVATWLLRGHGLWALEPKSGGDALGFVLLGFEDGDHEEELGYFLTEAAEGQGYAAEAAEAARAHAFEALGWPSLVSTIDHGNDRSAALAARLGATRDALAEAAHDNKIAVYRHVNEGGLQ